MKQHVTVVPSDRLIIVDGIPLWFNFSLSKKNMHALQWHEGSGHIEWKGDTRSSRCGKRKRPGLTKKQQQPKPPGLPSTIRLKPAPPASVTNVTAASMR